MNKILKLLVVTFFATATLYSNAENYGINVGGVEVSSSNYSNVTGSNITSGSVSYSPSTKTLTLNAASISRTTSDDFAVHNRSCDGLTIVFKGNCSLSSTKAHSLKLDQSTTLDIQSGATVNVSSGTGRALYLKSVELTFKGSGTINFKTTASGDACIKGGDATVVNIDGAHITAKSYNNYALSTLMINFHSGTDLRLINNGTKQLVDACAMASLVSPSSGKPAILEPYEAYTTSSRGTIYTSSGTPVINDDIYISDNYVEIIKAPYFPDTNLRTKLMTSYYPKGYITAADVASRTYMDLSYSSISDLTGINYFTEMTTLYCNKNSITNLFPLSALVKLKTLDCSSNQLTSLGTLATTLQSLNCSYNNLTGTVTLKNRSALKTLDCSHNTSLTELVCNDNALTSINVYECSALTSLDCHGNQLTTMGTLPSALKTINCSSNNFSGRLSVNYIPTLQTLNCSYNTGLTELVCFNNALTSINVNGCSSMTSLDCHNNQLTSMGTLPSTIKTIDCSKNQLTSLGTLPSALESLNCSYNKFTGTLTINSRSALKTLDCSHNTSLTELVCYGNALTSINVYDCPAMTSLDCHGNQLTTMGTLPSALKTINCSSNKFSGRLSVNYIPTLQTLDCSYNTGLTALVCFNNALTSINVNGCSAMTSLDCHNNKIVSMGTLPSTIKTIDCSSNQLTSLGTLPSALQSLDCSYNKFTGTLTISNLSALKTLDCSHNTSLTELVCNDNALTSINVYDCSALTSLDCHGNQLTTMGTLPSALKTINCSSNNFSGRLSVNYIPTLQTLDCSYNTGLTELVCCNNALTSINVNGCSAMTSLDCHNNKIVSMGTLPSTIKTIDCSSNQLTSLGTLPSALQSLDCSYNKFTGTLTISNLSALKTLDCSHNTDLTELVCCNNNALTSINVYGCSAMTSLDCHNNQLTTMGTLPSALKTINCSSNKFSGTLSMTYIPTLQTLDCSNNQLTALTVNGCSSLSEIDFENNQIKGDKMTDLIYSLRTIPVDSQGTLHVLASSDEGNEIDDSQVTAAREKRWIPYKFEDDEWVEITTTPVYPRGDIDGNGIVDINDLSLLIDVVLGNISTSDPEIKGNCDIDGESGIDVSDINILIDIVLGN